MKKSLVYYLSQIKEAYPEITDIKKQEFEKISAEINAQIQAGGPVNAHKKLYGKTYRFAKKFADVYEKQELDYKSFKDNLSALQLKIMEKIDKKVANRTWYPNFATYISGMFKLTHKYLKKIQGYELSASDSAEKASFSILVEDLINDAALKQCYERELKNVEINELRAILNKLLDSLLPRERNCIIQYYGLNGENRQGMTDIAKEKNLSYERVRQIITQALVRLRHPTSSKKLYDFYNSDSV